MFWLTLPIGGTIGRIGGNSLRLVVPGSATSRGSTRRCPDR